MSLEIASRLVEGVQILDMKGQLTLGQEDLDFRAELDRLVKGGTVRMALNFSDLRRLDTTGLGTLLFALAKIQKAGGADSIRSALGNKISGSDFFNTIGRKRTFLLTSSRPNPASR